MDTTSQMLGYLGSLISILTLLPQIIKMVKTKSVKDISITTFIIQIINVSVWLAYGILSKNIPLIVVNVFMFTNSALLIILKLKYTKNTII